MDFLDLEVIKSRTLLLSVNVPSPEVVLADPEEGSIFFVFELHYIPNDEAGVSRMIPLDEHHAKIEIEIRPDALVEPSKPMRVGTYGANHRPLYLGFAVEPQMGNSGRHNVTITFYVGKEVN